jgi:hypothetical protein
VRLERHALSLLAVHRLLHLSTPAHNKNAQTHHTHKPSQQRHGATTQQQNGAAFLSRVKVPFVNESDQRLAALDLTRNETRWSGLKCTEIAPGLGVCWGDLRRKSLGTFRKQDTLCLRRWVSLALVQVRRVRLLHHRRRRLRNHSQSIRLRMSRIRGRLP